MIGLLILKVVTQTLSVTKINKGNAEANRRSKHSEMKEASSEEESKNANDIGRCACNESQDVKRYKETHRECE